MRAADTTPEADAVHLEVYRAMGPTRRARAGLELIELSRRLLESGIRSRHPEYDESDVRWAKVRAWLGDDELFSRVYPRAPLLRP